jgi:hypothetical protein
VIQKHLVDRLALGLLQGEFAAGDHIEVDAVERSGDEREARGRCELRFTRSRDAGDRAVDEPVLAAVDEVA